MKLLLLISAVITILLCTGPAYAEEKKDETVEESTESPIAGMTLKGDAMKADAVKAGSGEKTKNETIKNSPIDSQPHTIADFIIHPLVAFKPRVPETESEKQSNPASSTTPVPWQLFNFRPVQTLGSSVSSLAGTVTNWLGNRIQLPSLVDTPVRESLITSTTTTTARPNIIVRIRQQPSNKKPSVSAPYRRNQWPNRFVVNYVDYSEENDDLNEYNDYGNFNRDRNNRRRYQQYQYDDDDSVSNEDNNAEVEDEDVDDEDDAHKGNKRPMKQQNNNLEKGAKPVNAIKRKNNNNQRRRLNNQQRKQQLQQEENYEEDQYDDDDEQNFHFHNSQLNLFPRGQQSLLEHNLRGQAIYLAPELLQVAYRDTSIKRYPSQYMQYPLSKPYKNKGQSTQYIAIPWSLLGISPPKKTVSLNKGPQTHRLVLQIPQKSMNDMQISETNKNKLSTTQPPARTATTTKPIKKISTIATHAAVATKNKSVPTRMHPAALTEIAPAAEDTAQNETSSESLEDDSNSSQFIVISDESVGKKFSSNAYRQIVRYLKQNRIGRQLNGDRPTPLTIDETKQQLIPVQIVIDQEEAMKDKEAYKNKLEMTTETHTVVDNSKGKNIEEIAVEMNE